MKISALHFGNGIQAWTPTVRRVAANPRFGKVSYPTWRLCAGKSELGIDG